MKKEIKNYMPGQEWRKVEDGANLKGGTVKIGSDVLNEMTVDSPQWNQMKADLAAGREARIRDVDKFFRREEVIIKDRGEKRIGDYIENGRLIGAVAGLLLPVALSLSGVKMREIRADHALMLYYAFLATTLIEPLVGEMRARFKNFLDLSRLKEKGIEMKKI